MSYRILADCIVVLHVGFVLFVVLGGLLVLHWRPLLWLHLSAAGWGVLVECMGWTCPLTPLENWLRTLSGEAGYPGDFISHYLLAMLYPEGLTRSGQVTLGVMVLVVNGIIYAWIWTRER